MKRPELLQLVLDVREPVVEEQHEEERLPRLQGVLRDVVAHGADALAPGVSELGLHVEGPLRTRSVPSRPSVRGVDSRGPCLVSEKTRLREPYGGDRRLVGRAGEGGRGKDPYLTGRVLPVSYFRN